ncbi:cAMP-dependent protein kinase regulatory subunit-like [Actinia tenebrosa]|uniref:cAMP-dependent protein kinase regulatory subunit-like n=1 Tax=Actinia tenebrosa TaxID=6105 RepID=A0A6P8H7G2_ACTTE|nr:cAMP-dependent protein kinase regulatory subunit-like [Actinia tenebrosa]
MDLDIEDEDSHSGTEDIGFGNAGSRKRSSVDHYLLSSYRILKEKKETEDKTEQHDENKPPSEESKMRSAVRRNFKKVAKAITKQRKLSSLLEDIAHQGDDHTKAKGFVAQTGTEQGQDRASFNVNAFKAHIQSCGAIPPDVKAILVKQSWNRSKEEVEKVLRIVKRMKGFNRYPLYVKRELARVVYHGKYQSGRCIIRQGHVGISFYFIVSGTVTVERIEEDRVTGEKHIQIVGEMSEGDSFGELALLHDIRRAATIICKTSCEFLIVDKDDFNEVLRMSHQIEYEKKMSVLSTHPAFATWTNVEKKQTVPHTKIRVFQHDMIILGGKQASSDFAYFIISGKCNVVREIMVVKKLFNSGKARYSLPSINDTKHGILSVQDYANKKIERKLLIIRTLNEGDFFGVGEDLDKTYIITAERVSCVLINHLALLKRDRGKYMEEMRQRLMKSFPTQQEAFKGFLDDYNWKQYKTKCIKDVVKKLHKPNCTTCDDVPLVVRRDNAYYFE